MDLDRASPTPPPPSDASDIISEHDKIGATSATAVNQNAVSGDYVPSPNIVSYNRALFDEQLLQIKVTKWLVEIASSLYTETKRYHVIFCVLVQYSSTMEVWGRGYEQLMSCEIVSPGSLHHGGDEAV